jgi:uncharacterized membrane protein YeaQ/YmgE (transglycosylase-associated protein family)
VHYLWWIVVGAVVGWVVGRIIGAGGFGAVVDLVVGACFGLLAGWLMETFTVNQGSIFYSTLDCIGAAAVVTAIMHLVTRNRRKAVQEKREEFRRVA